MTKPMHWAFLSFIMIILFYFVIDGGFWLQESKQYANNEDLESKENMVDRDQTYYGISEVHVIDYYKENSNSNEWKKEENNLSYSFYSSLQIVTERDDYPVDDVTLVMAWMFIFASISQFFICISFFCSLYHHFKVQMEYYLVTIISNISLGTAVFLPIVSGLYFFYTFPRAIQEESDFFSVTTAGTYVYNSELVANISFFGSSTVNETVYFSWRPAIYWFIYTFLLPILAVVTLIYNNSENVDSYYSDESGFEIGDSFMELPDHDDESHVSFREAVGYGVSTITYWIGYLFVVSLIGILFAFSSFWLMSKNTVTSYMLVSTFGFFYFILSFALILAISYKYLSDIRLRGNQSLVNSGFSSTSSSQRRASPLQPVPKTAKVFFDKKQSDIVVVSCPECSEEIEVSSTGKLQTLKCSECGTEGEITV